jgi:hypothetical protein
MIAVKLRKRKSGWEISVDGQIVRQIAGKGLAEVVFDSICKSLAIVGVQYESVVIPR